MRVEVDKCETAIAWLRDLIYGSEFDKERYVICFRTCRTPRRRVLILKRFVWDGGIGYKSLSLSSSKLSPE